ncbi:EAL domain-containing protein [Rhizobium skierniewicense]|uniref:EAL domain-containing protein n=1 Tax=Rhizobium skierniewicense TaxID=984260 RepID=UPI00157445E0|nr:EAL domain-containing protein [Rhizobium skierniewicense]
MSVWANIGDSLNQIIKKRAIAALLAVAISGVTLSAFHIIETREETAHRDGTTDDLERAVTLLHDRLVTRIRQDVTTLKALAHFTTINPAATPQDFSAMADHHLAQNPHFVGIGFAPNLKLQQFYPAPSPASLPHETLSAILSERLVRLEAVSETKNDWQPIIETGPNGTLLLLIVPVKSGGEVSGAIPGLIDWRRMLDGIGYASGTSSDIRFEIRDKLTNTTVAGDVGPAGEDPFVKAIDLDGTDWEIRATPALGWGAAPKTSQSLQATLVIAVASMLLPIIVAALLLSERNRNIKTLRLREAKLVELSQRFKLAMDSSNIGIWEIENDTSCCYLDERAASLHGFHMLEKRVLLTEWLTALVVEDRSKAARFFFTCSRGQQTSSEVYRIPVADGTVRYLRSAGSSYIKPDGSHQTTGIIWDVTADMLMAQKLRESRDTSDIKNAELELALQELSNREHELEELSGRLTLALESYNCGIWEATHDYSLAIWNERMCELYGLPPQPERRVTQQDFINCLALEERAGLFDDNLISEADPYRAVVHRVVLPDGSLRYVKAVGRLHVHRDGRKKIVGIAFDVTADVLISDQLQSAKNDAEAKNAELEQTKTRIEHNALHDPLTGLANRRKFDQDLDALSLQTNDETKPYAILHLDLDRFKQINDTLGHAAGDAVLAHAAGILKSIVPENDTVARIGGDEFVILIRNLGDKDHIKSIATKIIEAFSQPFEFAGFTCRYGVSIGIAFGDGTTVDARATLINADLALYRAKATGRNRYEFFTQNLQAEIINHRKIADEILVGLENGEFETWYQPQFCANSLEMTGVEALVRWRHPVRGILTPDKFLKIAEELNVVSKIDHLVLQQALHDKDIWRMKGIDVPRVSVNVSVRRLHDDHLIESLSTLPIGPGEITFELVEAIFLDEHEDVATGNIDRIKALGIEIEIDDFGTGHTSIISLLRLKPKRLKIDRQLVMPILTSPQERSLVSSIIDIAHSLGVETVAEGVETQEHAVLLKQLGCDILQGYVFARPLAPQDFSAFASAQEWRQVS